MDNIRDKREVILDFHSSPDAILNALHQAGWQVTPKGEATHRCEVADVMLAEGDYEGLANEVAKPNKRKEQT